MKGMDLASALAAPVQGRGSGQGARSRAEAGNTDAASFDTVFNDVHGVAGAAHRPTDDAGAGSAVENAVDNVVEGVEYASAAVQNPAVAPGDAGAAFAESAGQAAGHAARGLADQATPLSSVSGLPVQDGQAPSGAPVTVAANPGPEPRLAVSGAVLAATAQQAALPAAAPGTAQTSGPQPITSDPVIGLGTAVSPAAQSAAGGVRGVNSAAPSLTVQGSVADQKLSSGAASGATPGAASGAAAGAAAGAISGATSGAAAGNADTNPLAAPATGVRSATVLGNDPAPNTAPAGTPSPATPQSTAASGSAPGFPAAALAEGVSSRPARTGTPAAAPVTASVDALAAAGTAGATAAPAGQPTSSTAAAPQPAAPAAPPPGATLQPQLAKPLFTLAGAPQGQHIMTLQVTPEDLGPMTVRAHIDAAGVRIELFAPGDAGREAIRGILPELRKELADAGFGASLDVSEQTGPGNTARDGTSRDGASQGGAGRDSGSGPGNRNGPGDPRPGHRWDALADGDALRDARVLNGPQTTLDILV
jgi:Meckel syndrome type 1 protein